MKAQVEVKIGKTEVFNDFEFREYKKNSKNQTSDITSIQLLVRKNLKIVFCCFKPNLFLLFLSHILITS